MRKLVLSLAAILVSTSAFAADVLLPTKAQPIVRSALFNGYPYTTSGIYFGINTMGGGGSVEAAGVGVNPNSLVSNEIGVGGTLGYAWSNGGQVFYAVEGIFDWQNFNGNTPGFAFSGPATFEQRVKLGTPLTNFLSLFPTLGLPTTPPFPPLPNGQVATNVHPYLAAGVREDDISVNFGLSQNRAWRVMPTAGVGMMGQLSKGIAVDTWAEVGFGANSVCAGVSNITGGCGKVGNQYRVGFGVYY
jgi:hypothetical protein